MINNEKMIKIEISIENYKILNSILENGFVSYRNEWQSRNINQVIDHLLFIAWAYNRLRIKTVDEYLKLINKKRYNNV